MGSIEFHTQPPKPPFGGRQIFLPNGIACPQSRGHSDLRTPENKIIYRFDEPQAFYLRLIPTTARAEPLQLVAIHNLVK